MHKAMEEIAKKHGLAYSYKGGKFSSEIGNFEPKIVFQEKVKNAATGESIPDFIAADYAYLKMTNPGLIGKVFDHRGQKIEILGYRPKNRKFPVIFRVVGQTDLRKGDYTIMAEAGKQTKAVLS